MDELHVNPLMDYSTKYNQFFKANALLCYLRRMYCTVLTVQHSQATKHMDEILVFGSMVLMT